MLKEISVQNFKGILQSNIKDFNLINIFIGEFGSGKSTILDAIYLLKLNSEKSDCFKKIISRRTGRTPDLTSLWYTYEPDHQIDIKYTFQDSTYGVQLSVHPRDPTRIRLHTVSDTPPMDAEISWTGDFHKGAVAVGKEARFAERMTFLDSEMLGRVLDVEREILDPMKTKLLDHKLIEMLKEAFPTCKDYGFRSASPRQQQESRCYLDFGDSRVLIDDI